MLEKTKNSQNDQRRCGINEKEGGKQTERARIGQPFSRRPVQHGTADGDRQPLDESKKFFRHAVLAAAQEPHRDHSNHDAVETIDRQTVEIHTFCPLISIVINIRKSAIKWVKASSMP